MLSSKYWNQYQDMTCYSQQNRRVKKCIEYVGLFREYNGFHFENEGRIACTPFQITERKGDKNPYIDDFVHDVLGLLY